MSRTWGWVQTARFEGSRQAEVARPGVGAVPFPGRQWHGPDGAPVFMCPVLATSANDSNRTLGSALGMDPRLGSKGAGEGWGGQAGALGAGLVGPKAPHGRLLPT